MDVAGEPECKEKKAGLQQVWRSPEEHPRCFGTLMVMEFDNPSSGILNLAILEHSTPGRNSGVGPVPPASVP